MVIMCWVFVQELPSPEVDEQSIHARFTGNMSKMPIPSNLIFTVARNRGKGTICLQRCIDRRLPLLRMNGNPPGGLGLSMRG